MLFVGQFLVGCSKLFFAIVATSANLPRDINQWGLSGSDRISAMLKLEDLN